MCSLPNLFHITRNITYIVSERLGCSISLSECGGIEIEENWDKVKTIFLPMGTSFTSELCAPLVTILPLEIKTVIEDFIKVVYNLFSDLDFTFLEMNPFTLVDGKPYPLDMRDGETLNSQSHLEEL